MIARAPREGAVLVLRERRVDMRVEAGRDVVARILRARYGSAPDPPISERLLSFQSDAVARARRILDRRGGVLIADSVGLGKTHIALGLLTPAFRSGARVAVVGPAALRQQWRTAAADGDRFEWISYARLGRGFLPPARPDYVVFDEAHALRNPATSRYRAARALCRDARVVLLSATPVNNSVWDLYHLLRLFAGDRDFTDVGVPSLHGAFEQAETTCLLGTAPTLAPVLREVMIRRTRQVLAGLRTDDGARWRFPARRPPEPVYYAFARRDLLNLIGDALFELEFPLHGRDGPAPAELMRRSLLKRLESSVHALAGTLAAYDALLDRSAAALRRGLLVHARDASQHAEDDAQLAFDELLFAPAAASLVDALAPRLADERRVVERMRAALASGDDPKLAALRHLLARHHGQRVVVFTQFRDTARYLHEKLSRSHRVALIDGAGALLGRASVDRATVVRRFAPVANAAPAPPADEVVDVLVATDVLAEGFNLQDASVVVSYDLPWNPVRLLQRVGRVDRLGSQHPIVSSFHFVPGDVDRYLGLVDRLARKAAAIDATIGADAPVLHGQLVRAIDRRDGDAIARIEADDDAFAVDERMRALLSRIRPDVEAPPDEMLAGESDEGRTSIACVPRACAPESEDVTGVVAAAIGGRVEWVAVRAGVPSRDDRWCACVLESAAAEDGAGTPPAAARMETLLCAARSELARVEATIAATPLLPRGGSAARVARRILGLAAALPGGPGPALCTRIEACLERLAAEPFVDIRTPVRTGMPGIELGRLLDEIERLPVRRPASVPAPSERPVRIIGAILCERGIVDGKPRCR